MSEVFRFRPNQPISWYSTNLTASNQYCLYCDTLVGVGASVPSNREHLIGRNFVPPGKLDSTAFNFIFRACKKCNERKAEAERHVSSVSLHISQGRADDQAVNELATHKSSKDFHPRKKGILVKDASETIRIQNSYGSLNIAFEAVGPPQLVPELAHLLACNHIQALFSLVTSENPREAASTRLLDSKHWRLLGIYPWRDWGNVQALEVARRVKSWDPALRVITAGGYFKAILRPEPNGGEWFWALEWNRAYRAIGGLFKGDELPPLFSSLPDLNWRRVSATQRMREESEIKPEDDILFSEKAPSGGI